MIIDGKGRKNHHLRESMCTIHTIDVPSAKFLRKNMENEYYCHLKWD